MRTPRRLSILLAAATVGPPIRATGAFQDDPRPNQAGPAPGEVAGTARQGDRWAVIVGIAKYKDEHYNTLKYADRDAESLYDLLQTAPGGGFPRDHIKKLTNTDATTGAITSALRTFLKKPASDDLVLIYFSCHGVPDPERPANLYFERQKGDIALLRLSLPRSPARSEGGLEGSSALPFPSSMYPTRRAGPGTRSGVGVEDRRPKAAHSHVPAISCSARAACRAIAVDLEVASFAGSTTSSLPLERPTRHAMRFARRSGVP